MRIDVTHNTKRTQTKNRYCYLLVTECLRFVFVGVEITRITQRSVITHNTQHTGRSHLDRNSRSVTTRRDRKSK